MNSRGKIRESLRDGLKAAEASGLDLPGIAEPACADALLEQMVDSVHRVAYVGVILDRDISAKRRDPANELFDPLKAAVLALRDRQVDEACWLVFLYVHFGKSKSGGWAYARGVYGKLGQGGLWDWKRVSADVKGFRSWLAKNQDKLKVGGGFGNHRKRESLDAESATGTGAVVESYVKWVLSAGGHEKLFSDAVLLSKGDPHAAFHRLYESMDAVIRFGRLARFDYLAMIGKLRIAKIAPGSAYLDNATGPLKGAQLLFGNKAGGKVLDNLLLKLDEKLHVGMQVLEDSLCNWQKSPNKFKPFRI